MTLQSLPTAPVRVPDPLLRSTSRQACLRGTTFVRLRKLHAHPSHAAPSRDQPIRHIQQQLESVAISRTSTAGVHCAVGAPNILQVGRFTGSKATPGKPKTKVRAAPQRIRPDRFLWGI